MSFFAELRRRNVIKVAIAYLIVSWLLLQISDTLVPALLLPEWFNSGVAFVLILGFPLALIFAWAYEMTPEGLKKEKEVDRTESIRHITGRKLDFAIIGTLVLALTYFLYERSAREEAVEAATDVSATAEETVQPSIAVLPFVDMSPQGDQEYFSDGISEELLNLLVRVEGLKVASRTSSFSYKGDKLNISEIAAELQVALVLEGSVRKSGNRVRITSQLIDAATDRHLWSETYDRDLTDIFAIQDEIANAIVGALKSELGLLKSATTIVVKADTENLDAYQLYLEARGLFMARKNIGRSIELFNKAIELDPNFARAWEGLGAMLSVAEGWGASGENFDARARVAAQKAIDLDPSLSMAWAVIGSESIAIDADYVLAMNQFDQAIKNDPMNATAWFWRGIHNSRLGFVDNSISDISRCLEIDPAYLNCYRHLARVYLINGEIDQSLDTYLNNVEAGLSLNDFWLIHALLARDKKHAAAFLLISEADGDRDYPYKELLYAVENPDADHSATIAKLDAWIKRRGGNPKWRLAEWIALGAYDRVENVLDSNQIWLASSAQFRASPYFKPLVANLGLQAYWREKGFPPQCRPMGEEDFECD
ncbi:MAG: hypothetical protein BMS9Abin30_0368 [Gammaproteobacteria bacterium]|nr:MAG: hypothetical protein BMS9Abin30_0368 [Gammaproteobacteria bacterium]